MSADESRRILVVDDETDILEMMQSLLEIEGFQVLTAENGADAVAALGQQPDLVLLDIMMPDMDGHEVLQAIRAEAATRSLPVLMVTARNDVVDIGKALDAGVNGFVVKPFDTENLLRTVRSTLERRPIDFYTNYEAVEGVTSRQGTGYQQGDRIIFLDLEEADPSADRILEALGKEGVYLMSILQFDSARGTRQSSVLVTAENGMAFGAFLNALRASGSVSITACQIYKDALDLPQDLITGDQEYTLE
ncbi:response regulator [bacterium]|nr:response regulator [bacterium]